MKRQPFKRPAVAIENVLVKPSDALFNTLTNLAGVFPYEPHLVSDPAHDAKLRELFSEAKNYQIKLGDFVIGANAIANFYCLEETSLSFTDAGTQKNVFPGSLSGGRAYLVSGEIDKKALKALLLGKGNKSNGVDTHHLPALESDEETKQLFSFLSNMARDRTNKILFAYDPVVLGHIPPQDRTPEAPQRVARAVEILKSHPVFGFFTGLADLPSLTPQSTENNTGTDAATRSLKQTLANLRVPTRNARPSEIYAVHDEVSYKRFIEDGLSLSEVGPLAEGKKIPTDVYCNGGRPSPSQKAVLASCGLCIDALKRVVMGDAQHHQEDATANTNSLREQGGTVYDVDGAFCLIRPPGHHCGCKTPNGFCLVNNVVVAAKALLAADSSKKIAIVDCDVHHGEGTQSLIENDQRILYYSTHRCDEGAFFPYGTGRHTNFGGVPAGGANENVQSVSVVDTPVDTREAKARAQPVEGRTRHSESTANDQDKPSRFSGFGCCTSSAVDVAENRPHRERVSVEAVKPHTHVHINGKEASAAAQSSSSSSASVPPSVSSRGVSCEQCINVPFDTAAHIPESCHKVISDAAFDQSCDQILLTALRKFNPDVVIVSCGFDSLFGDPLGRMAVTTNGYRNLIKKIQDEGLGEGRGLVLSENASNKNSHHHGNNRVPLTFRPTRVVAVLEGGYNSEAVSHGVASVYGTLLLNKTIVLDGENGRRDICAEERKEGEGVTCETSSLPHLDLRTSNEGFLAFIDPVTHGRQNNSSISSCSTSSLPPARDAILKGAPQGESLSATRARLVSLLSTAPHVTPQTWETLRAKQQRELTSYRKIMAEKSDEERKRMKADEESYYLAVEEVPSREATATSKPPANSQEGNPQNESVSENVIVKKPLLEPRQVPPDSGLLTLHALWVESMVSRVSKIHPYLVQI